MYVKDLSTISTNALLYALKFLSDEICEGLKTKATPMLTFKTILMCDYSQELRRRGQPK